MRVRGREKNGDGKRGLGLGLRSTCAAGARSRREERQRRLDGKDYCELRPVLERASYVRRSTRSAHQSDGTRDLLTGDGRKDEKPAGEAGAAVRVAARRPK